MNSKSQKKNGPLSGLKVIEFAGLGPVPFVGMLLSDMGADVVTIDRKNRKFSDPKNIIGRGRSVVLADLKDPDSKNKLLPLIEQADIIIEGFRPGVMEKLGLGPNEISQLNPGLIYGRMTGWGQDGPLAQTAGHDINYLSITGALHAIGPQTGNPVPPLNLVGDYGGGSMYLLCGLLAALYERQHSGKGQVIDAAISDGVISMMSLFLSFLSKGTFNDQSRKNMLDGGAPYYRVYQTSDNQYISIGSIEPQFFRQLCETLNISDSLQQAQNDQEKWDQLHAEIESIIKTRTQDEWMQTFNNVDACVAPVLPLSKAKTHPHNIARNAFIELQGITHPAPAPRFSRTPSAIQSPAPVNETPIEDILLRWS